MKRVAFEIEVDDDDIPYEELVDRVKSMMVDAFDHYGAPVTAITELREPDPNTYHPQRRWLVL